MRYSLLPAVAMGFSALVQATFSSPKAGDSWIKGQENTISWDSSKTSGLSDISCVPAGSKDTSVVIAQIATQIDSSSGSYKWTPDKSISAKSVAIIIVDSKKSYTVSDTLTIIAEESSSSSSKGSGKGGNDYNSGKGKNSTETKSSKSHKTKSYESLATHSKSHHNSTKETMSAGQQITSSIIIAISTGTVATQTESTAAVTQTSVAATDTTSYFTPTYAASTPAPIVAANTSSTFLATGTGAAPAQASFTGGASAMTVGGPVAGGIFGLVVALFL